MSQAIQRYPILTTVYLLLKSSLYRFCDRLSIFGRQKCNSYDMIRIIIDCLTKIVYYKPVKTMINIVGLIEIIINVIIRHHYLAKSIISDPGLLFISKFWSLLYYFHGIKQKLSIAFYL